MSLRDADFSLTGLTAIILHAYNAEEWARTQCWKTLLELGRNCGRGVEKRLCELLNAPKKKRSRLTSVLIF